MTDERWKECKHHHHGCACREHEWEERVATLNAEIERLKAQPTAEQERKWVLRYISNRACHLRVDEYSEGSRALERAERTIEKGEHWPGDRPW